MAITVSLQGSGLAESAMARAYGFDHDIKRLSQQIVDLTAARDQLINELLSSGIRTAGDYEILEKHRVTRKINVDRLRAHSPDIYEYLKQQEIRRATQQAGKVVLLKDAERVLSKDEIDPLCDLQTSISYNIVRVVLE